VRPLQLLSDLRRELHDQCTSDAPKRKWTSFPASTSRSHLVVSRPIADTYGHLPAHIHRKVEEDLREL
jgi:hypothetical protein